MRGRLFTLVKIAVSLGLIVYLLGVNFPRIWELVSNANPFYLLLALLLYLAAITVGNLKWQILLEAQELRVPFLSLLAFTFVGLFFGNVLPSNVGSDVVRAYDLARHTAEPEKAAISVLVDRLVGLLAFFAAALVMALLAMFVVGADVGLDQVVVAITLAFGVLLLGFSLLLSRRLTRRGAFIFDLPVLAAFKPTAKRVFYALQVYRRSYSALFQGLLISISVVAITSLVQYAISEALGLGVSPFYFFLFNPLIAFVLVVPISVNGIGLKEAAFVFFLGLVGVPQASAVAISLVLHAVIVLSSLPGGLIWWQKRELKPAQA